jgi:hypothetical protein
MANVELVKAIKAGNVVTSLGELAPGDSVTMKGDGASTAGAIALNNAANTYTTTLQSGATSSNVTFTLPTADGTNGQILTTDGGGNLSFSTDAGGIAFSDLSVSTGAASGAGTLSYDNAGAFTFAPADLTTIEVVNDATPQLGGNLDVQSNVITTSTTNGSIVLTPDGSGTVQINGNLDVQSNVITTSTTNGNIAITPDGSGALVLDGLNWPVADGSAGQLLKTDGAGNLSFVTVSIPTGTMASQDANNVAITGGTIDNVAIGSTTVATSVAVDNLQLDANDITSTNTNGNINITPNGSGAVVLDGLSWPTADGSADQVIKTDGLGNLSFVDAGGATGTIASQDANNVAITGGSISNVSIGGTTSFDTTGTIKLRGCYPFGTNNLILGANAGFSLSNSGTRNSVVLGVNAACGATYLEDTVVIGEGALCSAVSTYSNVAIGRWVLNRSTTAAQVGIGSSAMYFSTSACCNTAIGHVALFNLTSGRSNVAVGFQAGLATTVGLSNTMVGQGAGAASADANSNVAIGYKALSNDLGFTTAGASFNTAVGTYALQFVGGTNSARWNTAVGINSMGWSTVTQECNTAVGANTMCSLTSGQCNTSIGTLSLGGVTSGSGNTTVGFASGCDALCTLTTQSNIAIFGTNTTTCFLAKVALTVPSDCRDKTDITDSPYGLNFINSIRPVSYKFDDRASYSDGVNPDGTFKEDKCRLGFIAQNVISAEQEHNPNGTLLISNNEREDRFSITETSMIPALVKAVQELTQRIEQLEMV